MTLHATVPVALALAFGCAPERQAPRVARHVPMDAPTPDAPAAASSDAPAAASSDAPAAAFADAPPRATAETPAPATLADALAALRARDLETAADVISRRVAQTTPKMRLAEADAHAAAIALLALADRAPIRELHGVMPRSTIELARAVRERGISIAEADAIATYLVAVVAALRFQRLAVFDENHSHVIGREWHEIDYTGEGMTWQSQREDWLPKGVVSFERASYIHAYFVGAERLPHWARVYKPRGRMAGVAPPAATTP